MLEIAKRTIPDEMMTKIIEQIRREIPFNHRGIKITKQLIKVSLECLNEEPFKTLPQNCRNLKKEDTPDGLDFRIKSRMGFDLRTANIVSDILEDAGIVKLIQVMNPKTGRNIKATKLFDEWTW